MAECVEYIWDTEGRLMWRHECSCLHDATYGIQIAFDDALPESDRDVIKAGARDRAHAARCEDDHPELVKVQRWLSD